MFYNIASFFAAIHCEWNKWVIGECSKPCGTGTQTNTRTKRVVEKNGGTCTGQPTEVKSCKIKECPGMLLHATHNLQLTSLKLFINNNV